MFYNLQEELRTVRNQHLTHGEHYNFHHTFLCLLLMCCIVSGIAQEDWKIEIENLKKEIALLSKSRLSRDRRQNV